MKPTATIAGILIIGTLLCVPAGAQQSPTLTPVLKFEVASVKKTATRAPMLWQPGGHFTQGLPLLSMVSIGFEIPLYRVEGLPDWGRTQLFEVNARANRDVQIEERPAYYRGLLIDRFNMATHVEQREMDVYTLTLARGDGRLGPGLRRSDFNCDAFIADARKRNLEGERLPNAPVPGQRPTCGGIGGTASFTGGAAPFQNFVAMLASALGRPIVDKTGLTGRFDIDFKAAPVNARAGGPLADLPPIFTAVEDQLGLRLQPGRAPVEVLVIDRLEMPAEN